MTSSALHSVDGQAPKDLKPLVVIAEALPYSAQGRRMCRRRLPDCRLLRGQVAVVRRSGSDKPAIAASPCADNAQTLKSGGRPHGVAVRAKGKAPSAGVLAAAVWRAPARPPAAEPSAAEWGPAATG
eukprot:93432-Chlamydomonas_euryale.AAC.1